MVDRAFKQIQPRHLDEFYPWVEMGVGFTGNHIYAVAGIDECFTEVFDENTLPAPIGMAAIPEQAYAQRAEGTLFGRIHGFCSGPDPERGAYSTLFSYDHHRAAGFGQQVTLLIKELAFRVANCLAALDTASKCVDVT